MAFETGIDVYIDSSRAVRGARTFEGAIIGMGRTAGRVTRSVAGSFDRVRQSIFSLQGAFAALGIGLIAKSFLDVGRELENLGVRMRFLTGSASEAAAAMETLTKFAAETPFELQQIANGANSLLVVAKSTDELNKLLEITGDLAVVSGLSFEETAMQMQRAFSVGMLNADLFQQRGVAAMLGFQSGVAVTAEETRRRIMAMWDDAEFRLKGAASAMATTWDGMVSMLMDKWFLFRKAVMDNGLFNFLKAGLQTVLDMVDRNFGSLEGAGAEMSAGIIEAIKRTAIGAGRLADALRPVFEFIRGALNNLFDAYNALPPFIQQFGIIGAILGGKKFVAVATAIAGAVGVVENLMRKAAEKFPEAAEQASSAMDQFRQADKLMRTLVFGSDPLNAVKDGLDKADKLSLIGPTFEGEAGEAEAAMMALVAAWEKNFQAIQKTREEQEKLTGGTRKQVEELSEVEKAIRKTIDAAELENRELELTLAGREAEIPLLRARNDLEDEYGKLTDEQVARLDAVFKRQQQLHAQIERKKDLEEEAKKAQEEFARQQEKLADEAMAPWNHAADNIQDAFADMFFNIGKEGQNFVQQMTDILNRLASEVAAAELRKLVLGENSSDGLGGLLKGATGNGEGGLGGIFDGIGNFFDGLFGGGSQSAPTFSDPSLMVGVPGFANGLDMIVPPGGGRDTNLFVGRVSAGERIQIMNQQQQENARRAAGGTTVNVTFQGDAPADPQSMEMMLARLGATVQRATARNN